MSDTILKVENIKKEYKNFTLNDISFELKFLLVKTAAENLRQ